MADEVKEATEQPIKKVKRTDAKGMLVSKLDFPVVINYKESKLQIPPQAKLKNVMASDIKDNLPKGIFFVQTN